MKNLLKTTTRIFLAVALCAAVSACGQTGSIASSSFPSYGSQASVSGQYVPPSILDY
jgi:hypothetical protein